MWQIVIHSLFFLLLLSSHTLAQSGFNPEYMGNGSPGPFNSFCVKTFASYFYQEGIEAHDAEIAIEPQYFFSGFKRDESDEFLFFAHLPIGFRSEDNLGQTSSVGGIGTLSAGLEYFRRVRKTESSKLWIDNGMVFGFPTATRREGIRIGGNAYSVTYFQEMFYQKDKWIFSVVPIAAGWGFRDDKTNERAGFSLSFANAAWGRMISSKLWMGVNHGVSLGKVFGSDDTSGNSLDRTLRAYVGPAGAYSFTPRWFLQFGSVFDVVTRHSNRGQGVFLALWHHML